MTQPIQLPVDRGEPIDLGKVVHAAWRDAMLAQGRYVADTRMKWETLDTDDHILDEYIAFCVLAVAHGFQQPTYEQYMQGRIR